MSETIFDATLRSCREAYDTGDQEVRDWIGRTYRLENAQEYANLLTYVEGSIESARELFPGDAAFIAEMDACRRQIGEIMGDTFEDYNSRTPTERYAVAKWLHCAFKTYRAVLAKRQIDAITQPQAQPRPDPNAGLN